MYKQQVRLFKWGYTINDNENETENEKNKTKKTKKTKKKHTDLGLDMNTNILNTKWVSVWSWLCIKKQVNVYIKTAVNVM